MAIFKKGIIRLTTARVLKELSEALEEFIPRYPSMSIEKILQYPDFHKMLPVRGLLGKVERDARGLVHDTPVELKDNIVILIFNIVWGIVSHELQYDQSIGTLKDLTLVEIMVDSFVKEMVDSGQIEKPGYSQKQKNNIKSNVAKPDAPKNDVSKNDIKKRTITVCSNCSQKLSVPSNRKIRVSCKKCGHVFIGTFK